MVTIRKLKFLESLALKDELYIIREHVNWSVWGLPLPTARHHESCTMEGRCTLASVVGAHVFGTGGSEF